MEQCRILRFTQFFCLTVAQDHKVKGACCTKVSTANVTDPIINIRMQHKSLPCVKAVIFETAEGEFCRDPNLRWVQEKVKKFFKKTTPTPTSSISNSARVGGSTQTTVSLL
uniref:Chemokine (C-C motif) ligand 34b, duplicate 1 n=1 Tax=Cyprinus carpio carpio TaxID=630221 RepID=A0A9J7XV35_CYPCA